jgi:osmotically-inducible protein OsmY
MHIRSLGRLLALCTMLLMMLPAWGASTSKEAVKKATANASDAEIDRNLKIRLGRSKIAADKFEYKVQGGVVTWTGTTNVVQHKGAATRMAKSSGAHEVHNKIQISEAARQKSLAQLAKGRKATIK